MSYNFVNEVLQSEDIDSQRIFLLLINIEDLFSLEI